MSAPRTQLVIFDCDGVLVDSEPISVAVLVEALNRLDVPISEADVYDRFLGRSLATVIDAVERDHGVGLGPDFLDGMRAELYRRFQAELKPIAGMAETLDGLPVASCVASSSQMERIRLSLTVTGLIDRLPNIFSATMVARGKPAPDLFLHAARSMRVEPADCLVIEDSPAGIQAARAAGMRVFAFTGGTHARLPAHRAEIEKLSPDLVFDAMPDLLQFLS